MELGGVGARRATPRHPSRARRSPPTTECGGCDKRRAEAAVPAAASAQGPQRWQRGARHAPMITAALPTGHGVLTSGTRPAPRPSMITGACSSYVRRDSRDHGNGGVGRQRRGGPPGVPGVGIARGGGRGPYGGDGVGAALGEVPRIAGVDELARRDGYASARGAIAMLIELYR